MNRTLVERILIGIFIIEAAVPAVLMATTAHQRYFAWSMYSASSTKYRYVGVAHYSRQLVLDPAEAGSPWNAIHYGPRTLQLLCAAYPEVNSITRYYGKRAERVEQC